MTQALALQQPTPPPGGAVSQASGQASAYAQLSQRDRKILDAYFESRSVTEAVRKAFPAARSPESIGSKWKKKPLVQAAMVERRERLLDAVGVTPEMILREWKVLAFGDVRELFDEQGRLKPLHLLTEDQAALIASIESREMLVEAQQPDMFAQEGAGGLPVIGVVKQFKRWSKIDALRELTELAALKTTQGSGSIFNVQINF